MAIQPLPEGRNLLFLLACKAATPSDAAFGIRPGDPLSKYADTATVASVQEHMYYIHPPNPSPLLIEYLVWIEPKAGACFVNANSPVWNLYRRRDDVQVFLHYQAQIKEVLEAKYGPATFDGQNILRADGTEVVRWTITVPGHETTGETPSIMSSIKLMDTALMDAGLNPCAWYYFERWACGA